MRIALLITILLAAAILLPSPMQAATSTRGARVNNLKVLSDKVEDVTTVENILKSFVKPGMSQQERAKAIWTATVKYRHQAPPPDEMLAADTEAHDPVKLFNVYGYCQCCCASAIIQALNRLDGRETQGRILTGHSVPEVRYGDAWHMFDASLLTYFPKPDGTAAAVDEIAASVRSWLDANPTYRKNDPALRRKMQDENNTAWKTDGPALLADCPFYTRGWFPAGTHGWYSTMQEYDRQSEVYEYGYQLGHRALLSLRPGESFVRDAGNHGLHVNNDRARDWDGLRARAPQGDLVFLKSFFPGFKGNLVGNGLHRYAPDLAAGGLAQGAERYENLAAGGTPHSMQERHRVGAPIRAGGSPALHLERGGKPGVAVIEMTSPYVYLGGRIRLRAVRRSAADRVTLSLSTNNGRTFTPLWSADQTGSIEAVVELKDRVHRRYAYWLKIEIESATPQGAGLESLSIESDIQHSPRTLPWLGPGANTITVAADADTGLASRSIIGRITPDAGFSKNQTATSLGVRFDNLNVEDGACWWKGGAGSMTVPIETPGEIAVLRFGAQVRARGDKDAVRMLLSFDGGSRWQEAGRIQGPTPGATRYFRVASIPPGTRKALLRYELTGSNTIGIYSFRVDADYRDPLAAPSFRPFRVIHAWKENGQEKRYTATVTRLPFTYEITTAAEPEMVSVSYEMAAR